MSCNVSPDPFRWNIHECLVDSRRLPVTTWNLTHCCSGATLLSDGAGQVQKDEQAALLLLSCSEGLSWTADGSPECPARTIEARHKTTP